MENSVVRISANQIYITHAEYRDCFIKIWANLYTKKRSNMEKMLQDYTNFSKEFTKLDLCGLALYIYVWKTNLELRVYRCQVLCTDLVAKTHTIILLDYGQQMVVPYSDVREVTKDIDNSILNVLSQRATVHTFLLSEYTSKPKSNSYLINTLCNKYYKYRRDFEIGGMTFVTLFDTNDKLIKHGLADSINIASMFTIANSMASSISLHNTNDGFNSVSIQNKSLLSHAFLRSQCLDCVTPIDVSVTRAHINNNSILLTVRTLDNDSEALNNMLNSLDRQNLKLAPALEVFTPCLTTVRNKLVRAIILEVKIDGLCIDLVDYGIRENIPRAAVFEIPPKCNLFEMRSLNVILDKPKDITVNESMFVQKYFQMLPLKLDPNFGLYKVKLFKKTDDIIDMFDDMDDLRGHCLSPSKSPELFSITEIQDEIESKESSLVNSFSMSFSSSNNKQIEKNILEPKENINKKETEIINQIEKPLTINRITPISFLRKESLKDIQEIVGSLIYYKSPFNFRVRKYNPDFEPLMEQIKSSLNSRLILTQNELVKNMYVIYQKNQSDSIYRGQIIDMDREVEKIKLKLVDDGDEIINEHFSKITLYNFIESDCHIAGQLVLDCALSNMWFPVINIDTISLLEPYFNKRLFYKVLIVQTDENFIHGVNLVQMVQKDTNIDISETILKSGIGQRLCAAMKTDECPYEENLLKGQSFLSYIYHHHFKLCIQPEPNTVDELEEEIKEYITENPDPESFDVNNFQYTYCLATVNNDQWYRAYIKNINEESVIVNMFDIGLLTDVSFKHIRPITSNLMRKPQLCLHCKLETKELTVKITEKILYNVTVKSIDTSGMLSVIIQEHHTVPLSNPIIRSLENISFVHVDGDSTFLQRPQDKLMAEKMSETLLKLNGKLESKSSIESGDMVIFESHGKYYRSIVKSINFKMAVVNCIDFGYEKQVEKKKLQYLGHSKIALLPALVTIVKTFPMAFNMSKTMFLADMCVNDDGTLNAIPNKMTSIQTKNELMETLQKGCLVKVTCIYTSNNCWIVPHLYFDRLKTISDKLLKMQSKIIPAVTEIGSLCAAQNLETKEWHRALILDADKITKNVLSIDSGEQFIALKTTKLIGEIQKIPNCALHCQVVSNVDIKYLLNKDVKCKLISCTQPLLEVELFSDNKDEITPTQSDIEWKIVITRFESFNKFYVQKVKDEYSSACVKSNNLLTPVANQLKNMTLRPPVGSIIETQTDKADGVWYTAEVMAPHNDLSLIVRILSDGTICKSTKIKDLDKNEQLNYHCCLLYDIDDAQINDPNNFDCVSNIMMSHEWTMKTSSDREPYKVTLTINGLDCIDILYKSWPTSYPEDLENSNLSESITEPKYKDQTLEEYPVNNIAKTNSIGINYSVPDIEIVTILNPKTYKCFYAKSESLFKLYMEQITIELDMCIVQLPMVSDMVGSIVVMNSNTLNRWCRARVHEVYTDGTASCYLLDDGVYDYCNTFYKPTDFLSACPPIVRYCSLYTPKLDGKENEIWFPDVDYMFIDIVSIEEIKFEMIIKEDRVGEEPYVVILKLDTINISEMLTPINVQVTCINSLTDFKITAISKDQKYVTELLETYNESTVIVKNPTVNNMYLANLDNKLKRVKFDALGGIKYVIIDIDDTLNYLSVDKLYEIPQSIINIPPFIMACSLILKDGQDMYSMSKFQSMAKEKVTFIMCIIIETVDKTPNLVKLYHNDRDVLDILKV